MKKILFYLVIAASIVLFLSCSEEEPSNPGAPEKEAALEMTGHSECKSGIMDGDTTSGLDCMEYEYSDGVLILKHINAGFNCCPENFDIKMSISKGIITIDETKIDGLCDCSCLYDLDLKIFNLEPGKYKIVVLEPLAPPKDQPLEFDVDLVKVKKGKYCVDRSSYPW